MRKPPASPERCPKCNTESPCTDWNEVDIGVGVQCFDYRFTCPEHGEFAFEAGVFAGGTWQPGKAIFRDEEAVK